MYSFVRFVSFCYVLLRFAPCRYVLLHFWRFRLNTFRFAPLRSVFSVLQSRYVSLHFPTSRFVPVCFSPSPDSYVLIRNCKYFNTIVNIFTYLYVLVRIWRVCVCKHLYSFVRFVPSCSVLFRFLPFRYVSLHFTLLCLDSFRFAPLRSIASVLLRFATFHCISLCFVSFHYVSLRLASLRFAEFRYVRCASNCFAKETTRTTHETTHNEKHRSTTTNKE